MILFRRYKSSQKTYTLTEKTQISIGSWRHWGTTLKIERSFCNFILDLKRATTEWNVIFIPFIKVEKWGTENLPDLPQITLTNSQPLPVIGSISQNMNKLALVANISTGTNKHGVIGMSVNKSPKTRREREDISALSF